MLRSLPSLALLAITAVSAQAAVVIADTNMFDADYTGLTLFNALNASSPASAFSASGGNTGNHRVLTATLGSPGFAYVSERNTITYDPSSSGAITNISFTIDAYSIPAGAQIGFLVHQNGGTYYHVGHYSVTGSYTADSLPVTSVSQFNLNFVSGNNPDFSASGAPIQFGYFMSISNFSATGATPAVHLDNFCVAVNGGSCQAALTAVPEPGTFGLIGAALVAVGAYRRRRPSYGLPL